MWSRIQLNKGLYWKEVMQNINYNLSRRVSGANGIGKIEQNEKGEQIDCRSSQEAGSRLLELVEGLVYFKPSWQLRTMQPLTLPPSVMRRRIRKKDKSLG